VKQVSISSNPFGYSANVSHKVRDIMRFFWAQDALRGFTHKPFEFAVCKRIKDAWYSSVVDECRDGNLQEDTFNFLHGYPTTSCGSFLKTEASICECQQLLDAALDAHRQSWQERVAKEVAIPASTDDVELSHSSKEAKAAQIEKSQEELKKLSREQCIEKMRKVIAGENVIVSEATNKDRRLLEQFRAGWDDALEKECIRCKEERARRKRVLDDGETNLSAEFALAPLITAMNKPRYLATQQRAKLFAEFHKTQVLWIQAEDFPIAGDIAAAPAEVLNKRRQNDFLQRHDQSTGGIMGLFPMVYNLPVTFTANVDKKRKIFKFTCGHIVGWTLSEQDEKRVQESSDFEIVLQKQPKVIFIRRELGGTQSGLGGSRRGLSERF